MVEVEQGVRFFTLKGRRMIYLKKEREGMFVISPSMSPAWKGLVGPKES